MEVRPTSHYAALEKVALFGGEPLTSEVLHSQYITNDKLRRETGQYIAKMLMSALGAGALARGALSLHDFLYPTSLSVTPSPSTQQIDITMPKKRTDDEKQAGYKQASVNMTKFVQRLFSARDSAHAMHLKYKGLPKHLALNEFYDAILDEIDSFIETYQGQYGVIDPPSTLTVDSESDPAEFIKKLCTDIRTIRGEFSEDDTHLQNILDEMLSTGYRTIYKLENLDCKTAAASGFGKSSAASGIASGLGDLIYNNLLNVSEEQFNRPGLGEAFAGAKATTPWGIPATGAVGFPLAVLAALGSWSGVGALANRRAKEQKDEALNAVKAKYEQLLNSDLDKASADNMLDDLLAGIEKAAEDGMFSPGTTGMSNTIGGLSGAAMGAAALVSALSGVLGYKYFRKRTGRTLTEQALLRRARARTGGFPPAYAKPIDDAEEDIEVE